MANYNRKAIIESLKRERVEAENKCEVVDGVDVYEILLSLFQSDKTDEEIINRMEEENKKKNIWAMEFDIRATMNEEAGDEEGEREERMRVDNQFRQSWIIEDYLAKIVTV